MALPDADLASIQQARTLTSAARAAQRALAVWTQEQVDGVIEAMATAAHGQAERLARLAHEETGFGNVADKTRKNVFASAELAAYMRPMRTVGVLREDAERGVVEIGEGMGVVAAIIPSTNPTSTAIHNALVAIKARNACVMSPHPSAAKCILETVRVLHAAGVQAGLPSDALACLERVTLEGTQELMRARDTAVILATGGVGLVRAAYSSGKPAYGVGPGNVPVFIHRSADVSRAAADVVAGKTFDFGTLCSSEQAVVCDEPVKDAVMAALRANGGYFMSDAEAAAVARVVVTPQRLANPEIVGRPAPYIAARAGVSVPPETRVLIAPLGGVGREFPLSIEKLSPVLAFYVVKDWQAGVQRCQELLRFGGLGHTAGIHSADDQVIREFALAQPASRVIANTQTSMGATGATTSLAPSMSLGCGAWAGNMTSDNVTPLHLINVKRLAYARQRTTQPSMPGLASPAPAAPAPAPAASAAKPSAPAPAAVDFVCEDDVRRALRDGRRLRVLPGAIVTPAARDLAEGTSVLLASDGA